MSLFPFYFGWGGPVKFVLVTVQKSGEQSSFEKVRGISNSA